MVEVVRTNTRVLTAVTLADLQALGSNDGIESDMVGYATNQNAWLRPSVINPTSSTWVTISGGANDLGAVLTVGNDSLGNNIVMSTGSVITSSGQNLVLSASTGLVTTPGDLSVGGKLTVTGLIDPTGLELSSQGTAPSSPAGNDGLLWVYATGELIYDNPSLTINIVDAILGQGTFLDAFTRSQWGYITSSTINATLAGDAALSRSGFLKDSITDVNGTSTVSRDRGAEGIFLTNDALGGANDWAAIRGDSTHLRRDQAPLAVFKIRQQDVPTTRRLFVGLTNRDASQHSTTSVPVGVAQYIGVSYDASGSFLSFTGRNGTSTSTSASTVAHTNTSLIYVVIDMNLGASADALVQILDEDFTVLDSTTFNASAPLDATALRPMSTVVTTDGSSVGLQTHSILALLHADKIKTISGLNGGGGSQNLSSVLGLGDFTGGNNIELTNGDAILGEDVSGTPTPLIISAANSTGAGGAGGTLRLQGGDGNVGGGGGGIDLLSGSPAAAGGGAGSDIFINASDGAGSTTGNGGNAGRLRIVVGKAGDVTGGTGNGGTVAGSIWFMGDGGDSVGGTPGFGGAMTLQSGKGGAATGGTDDGAVSGNLTLATSDGGNSVGGAGGGAGPLSITGGFGGNATAGSGDGGNGTNIIITAGDGGTSSGGLQGLGGDLQLVVGAGSTDGVILLRSAAANPTTITMQVQDPGGGAGNDLLILGATSPDDDGGDLTMTAGSSASLGAGGGVNLNAGAGPTGGDVILTAGAGSSGASGLVNLVGGLGSGSAGSGLVELTGSTGDTAGTATIRGADQTGTPGATQAGGATLVTSGTGAINAAAAGTSSGAVTVETPAGVAAVTGDGGDTGALSLTTGIAGDGGTTGGSTGGDAGILSVVSGTGGSGGATNGIGGAGGMLLVIAGDGGDATGTGTQGDGGNLVLTAGGAGSGGAGGGTGGSVILTPGSGTLAAGVIDFAGLIGRDSTGYKHGIVAAAAAATTAIAFSTAFPAGPALTIGVTIEGAPASAQPVHFIHTISSTGFTVEFVGGAPPGGTSIHFTARQ